MAVPLVGIGALITSGLVWLVRSYFAASLAMFGWKLAKSMALITLAVTLLGGMFLAFALAIKGMLSTGYVALPSWAIGATAFVPGNVPVIISGAITARLTRRVYDWSVSNFKWAVESSNGLITRG